MSRGVSVKTRRAVGRGLRGALVGGALLLSTSPSWAAPPGQGAMFDSTGSNYDPGPPVRRGGFAAGFIQGFGVGNYRGYPLSITALNDPNGEQSTGVAFTSTFGLWVGGSLRDWLTVGAGFFAMGASGDVRGSDVAFMLHLETYPFFSWGGLYQDLGIGLDGGLGTALLAAKDDTKFEDPIAEGGSMSTLAVSAFWEPLRFWHFSMGPQFVYTHGFSQTMHVNQATLGIRMSVYGVQPKKDAQSSAFGQARTVTAGRAPGSL